MAHIYGHGGFYEDEDERDNFGSGGRTNQDARGSGLININPEQNNNSNINFIDEDSAGTMDLQSLLPNIDLSKYDMSEFEDMMPDFSTYGLELAQQQGRANVSNSMSGAQSQFMQTPTNSQISGAGGFGGSGGGSRGLIDYGSAQRGMFSGVQDAMLGAQKSEFNELESLKREAGDFFSDILPDLERNSTSNTNSQSDAFSEFELGESRTNPTTGSVEYWNGTSFVEEQSAAFEEGRSDYDI